MFLHSKVAAVLIFLAAMVCASPSFVHATDMASPPASPEKAPSMAQAPMKSGAMTKGSMGEADMMQGADMMSKGADMMLQHDKTSRMKGHQMIMDGKKMMHPSEMMSEEGKKMMQGADMMSKGADMMMKGDDMSMQSGKKMLMDGKETMMKATPMMKP